MIILIAESKTMTPCDRTVAPEILDRHRPTNEGKANIIMDNIATMAPQEIVERARLSFSMAQKIWKLAKEFSYKNVGQPAIEAFTGVVFKALDLDSLTTEDRHVLCQDVRIISSIYGWLRPDDIIKAYRMEYSAPLAPEGKTMAAYWRGPVTVNLVREIEASGCKDILNLLPADAAKCVDWKLVKRFAKVWKVDFKELKDGGQFATPHAGRLKTLRGKLLREIIDRRLKTPAELLSLATPQFLPMGCPDYPDHIAFCV